MANDPQASVHGQDASHLIRDTGITRAQMIKLGAAAALVALCVGFVTDNRDPVETGFVLFSVQTQLWLGLFVALVVGALVGLVAGLALGHRRRTLNRR